MVLKRIFTSFISFFKRLSEGTTEKYEIISVEENTKNSEKIYVKIRMLGTRNIFIKPVSELYTKQWIDNFSKEDGAFLAVLYVSEKDNTPEIIKLFPRKKKLITKHVVFLGMMFVTFLILSNLTAFKIIEFNSSSVSVIHRLFGSFDVNFPAALIFFPLTYFFDNTLTEVYGFRVSRYIIWGGLICNTIFTLGAYATVYLHPSHMWHDQSQYAVIFTSAPRIFLASALGYFCGEFLNSAMMSILKIKTLGKWLWLRVLVSTATGVSLDSVIFCHTAFFGMVPSNIVWQMVAVQVVFKVTYAMLILPLTYIIVRYLKKKDNVDYYDFTTKYNPFSLALDDAK